MIEAYNNSMFSQFVDYNSEEVHLLAENLFEKIRGNGILPTYIDRSKEDRIKSNIDRLAINFVETSDSDFTFGKCIYGTTFRLTNLITLPSSFTIDLEVKAVGSSFEFSLFNKIFFVSNQISFDIDSFVPTVNFNTNTFYKIKIVKSNTHVIVYSNDVEVVNGYTATNIIIDGEQDLLSSVSLVRFANILIRDNQDKIVNWWKMNFVSSSNLSPDSGDGDYDFYSFWFSYCYMIALVSNYRESIMNIEFSDFMLDKFIQSKGVAV